MTVAEKPQETPGDAFLDRFVGGDPAEAAENVILERVAALLDRIERHERQVVEDGDVVKGGNGQPTAHPLLASIRADSATVAKLLDSLRRPGSRSRAGSDLARARWSW